MDNSVNKQCIFFNSVFNTKLNTQKTKNKNLYFNEGSKFIKKVIRMVKMTTTDVNRKNRITEHLSESLNVVDFISSISLVQNVPGKSY